MLRRSLSIMASAVKAQKKALRNAMSTRLCQLSSADLDQQSEAITSRLLALPTFHASSSISCYLNMPSGEARTSSIVHTVLQSQKKLFVPKNFKQETRMDFLQVYSSQDLSSIPSGTWGIKEPAINWEGGTRTRVLDKEVNLDLIVVPGLAFDREFHRLGHGKGYYDRFISSYVASGRSKPLLVAICLREQLLQRGQVVPHEEDDWNVDVLITPDETIVHQEDSA